MRHRIRSIRVIVASLAVLGMLVGTSAGAQASTPPRENVREAELTLVHGVPGGAGFPVDITLSRRDGFKQVFRGVTFGTVAGPLRVDPGTYRVAIRPAGAPQSSKPVLSKWVGICWGKSKSVVAHLSATGTPRMSVYMNDISSTGGKARVTIRHNAAAPAVDVYAGRSPVIQDLVNPYQRSIVVPAGTYPISVAPANTSYAQRVFGPADLTFGANTLTVVYAVGSLRGGTFTPLVQVLPTR